MCIRDSFKFSSTIEWLAAGLELNIVDDNLRYSLQYYRLEEFHLFDNSAERTQIGFKIGKQTEGSLIRFKYQAGVAYYNGNNSGFYFRNKIKEFHTIGLTTAVGLEYMPFSFLSIGLDLETNINKRESIYMPLLKISLGKIR